MVTAIYERGYWSKARSVPCMLVIASFHTSKHSKIWSVKTYEANISALGFCMTLRI